MSFSDELVEYSKIEYDGTTKVVFRHRRRCQECFQMKSCFILREGATAKCADCDVKRLEPAAV